MRGLSILLIVLGLCTAVARAADEVTVVVVGSGAGRPATVLFDAGEAINATNGLPTIESTDTLVKIYSTSSLAHIGRVTFTANSRSTDLQVLLGSGSFPATQGNLSSAGLDWGGLADPPANLTGRIVLAGAVDGDVTGSVKVKSIFRLEVGDELQAPVEATGSGDAVSYLEYGASTSSGTVTASAGNIVELWSLSTTSTLSGAVAAAGVIENITAKGGVSIATGGIQAADGIDSIIAGYLSGMTFVPKDIDAVIDANTANHTSGASGSLLYLECGELAGSVGALDLGEVTGAGTYESVVAETIAADLAFTGSVFGKIVADSFTPGANITIGGDLRASILASGDIQDITILGQVRPAVAAVVIASTGGSIGDIAVSGELQSDTPGGIVIDAAEGVASISCALMLNVHVGPQTFPGTGMAVGSMSVTGSVSGSIHLSTFGSIDIGGALESQKICSRPHGSNEPPECETFGEGRLVVNEVPASCYLRIGSKIATDASLIVENESPALAGQIILNAGGVYTGILDGTLTVQGESDRNITSANYAYLRSELGGGAVGVVPFQLHLGDSTPASDPYPSCPSIQTEDWPISHGGGTRETIVLQFYGPVFDFADDHDQADDPDTVPLVIMARSLALCTPDPCYAEFTSWTNATAYFDVYVPGNGSAHGSREVWVARKPYNNADPGLASHEFIITPALDGSSARLLRCDRTFAAPASAPQVAAFTYELNPFCDSFSAPPEE